MNWARGDAVAVADAGMGGMPAVRARVVDVLGQHELGVWRGGHLGAEPNPSSGVAMAATTWPMLSSARSAERLSNGVALTPAAN
jgi:hypothetical protein